MGTVALFVPEGTKGDFHLRTSEQAWFPVGKWMWCNQHIKCYRQNSIHILCVLFPANTSFSTCCYSNLGAQAGTKMELCRVGKGHQSKTSNRILSQNFCRLNPNQLVPRRFQIPRSFFKKNLCTCMIAFKVDEQAMIVPRFPSSCPEPAG